MNSPAESVLSGSRSIDQKIAQIEVVKAGIAELLKTVSALSISEKHYFFHQVEFLSTDHLGDDALVEPEVAAHELKVTSTTLSIWRCTGRYHLPYVKIGRLVRYRIGDLREFKRSRLVDTRPDSSEAAEPMISGNSNGKSTLSDAHSLSELERGER